MPAASPTTLRLWPAWVIVFVQWALLLFQFQGEYNNFIRFIAMMAGPLVCLLAYVAWWLFLSRLQGRERWLTPGIAAVAAAVVVMLVQKKVGIAVWTYGIPVCLTLLTAWLTLTKQHHAEHFRTTALLAAGCWVWLLAVRLDGLDGSYLPELSWRWTPSSEEALLLDDQRRDAAKALDKTAKSSELALQNTDPLHAAANPPSKLAVATDYALQPSDWPAYRGPQRNSSVHDVKLADDWKARPPQIVWKHACGPGWGSMCVVNKTLFTQEQRGEDELVIAYDAATGEERWRHRDRVRFDEVVAGTGPRATPAYDQGRVYTYGSKALVNCLDAATGQVVWQRDLLTDYKLALPMWAYSCSPVVVDGRVFLYMDLPKFVRTEGEAQEGAAADDSSKKDAASLIALDAATGKTVWQLPITGQNYSSVEPLTLGSETVLLFGTDQALLTIDPREGRVLSSTPIPAPPGIPAMVQPQALPDGGLLISTGDGQGMARFDQTGSAAAPTWQQQWVSKKLKPSFNDYVVHQNYVYGFDQNILACLDAKTGEQQWKRGRYGFGQMLLFPASSHLLVLSETGDVVLVAADPTAQRELGKFRVIEGKTWNHPAWADGKLYVRNGAEIACFQLPLAE